jgi:sugar phosphate isomerase/epimerase
LNSGTRFGTTSYIIEAGLLENLLWLSRPDMALPIGEMQLVLFETPGLSNIPSPKEAADLASAAKERDMAFTVHLPGNIELGNPDDAARAASCELFKRVVGVTQALEPICWTLHIPLPSGEDAPSYIERTEGTLAPLLRAFDSPRELAIENIYPVFDVEGQIVEDLDASVAIDVGHLNVFRQDVWGFMDLWMNRCRNMHIHGCDGHRDHESLALLPDGFLSEFLSRVALAPGLRTITMEVFGVADFESSSRAIAQAQRACEI